MTVDPVCRDADGVPPHGHGRAAGRSQWAHRRGLERRLHDGVALQISALALRLGLVRHQLPVDDTELHGAVDDVQDELHAVLQELRGIAADLYPPLLDEAGLGPALREEIDRRGVPVALDLADERFDPAAEGAAYFAVRACLDAAAGERVTVTVRRDGADLLLRVGGARGPALAAVRENAEPLGGTVELTGDRRTGAGTITARFPCA